MKTQDSVLSEIKQQYCTEIAQISYLAGYIEIYYVCIILMLIMCKADIHIVIYVNIFLHDYSL